MKLCIKLLLITTIAGQLCAAKMPEFSYVGTGDKAPAFEVTTIAGKTISTEQLKGKVVLVNFFATWCGPCLQKMPMIDTDIYQIIQHEDFVMVNIGREHSVAEIALFKQDHGYQMPFAADPKRVIYNQYAEKMIPRSVIIGKDGVIKLHSIDSDKADVEKLKKVIQKELQSS